MKKLNKKFSIIERVKSFKHAFNGLKTLVVEEHNSRIHFAVSIIVILSALIIKLTIIEWIIVIFSIALVITVETINSAIENMADFLTLENNKHIKKIKDLSAAAVLISALSATVIGLLIFIPKLINLLKF